eukprot:gene19177-19550_t
MVFATYSGMKCYQHRQLRELSQDFFELLPSSQKKLLAHILESLERISQILKLMGSLSMNRSFKLYACISVGISSARVNTFEREGSKLKSWQRERTGRALHLSNEFIADLLRVCNHYHLQTVLDTVSLLLGEFTAMTQQEPQNNIAEKIFDLLDYFPIEVAPNLDKFVAEADIFGVLFFIGAALFGTSDTLLKKDDTDTEKVSWLEMLLVEVALRNRDRFASIWPLLRDHYTRTIGPKSVSMANLSYIAERRVVGLLKVSTRMISREHYAKEILQLLGDVFATSRV